MARSRLRGVHYKWSLRRLGHARAAGSVHADDAAAERFGLCAIAGRLPYGRPSRPRFSSWWAVYRAYDQQHGDDPLAAARAEPDLRARGALGEAEQRGALRLGRAREPAGRLAAPHPNATPRAHDLVVEQWNILSFGRLRSRCWGHCLHVAEAALWGVQARPAPLLQADSSGGVGKRGWAAFATSCATEIAWGSVLSPSRTAVHVVGELET